MLSLIYIYFPELHIRSTFDITTASSTSTTFDQETIASHSNITILYNRHSYELYTMENNARPDSNFDSFLNYDIRYMVYKYLDLPPRSKTNCGFALSYTSAYEEIRAASVKPHSEYLGAIEAEFFAKTSHKAHIPPSMMSSTFAQLRNVLIEVPTSLAHMMVSEMQLHDALENILMLFYPIFEQLFAAVIIVLKDGADTHSLRHDLTAGGVKNVDLKWLIGRLLGPSEALLTVTLLVDALH
jgi:hypothetical protein